MSPPSGTSLPPSIPSHPSRLSPHTRFEFPASYSKLPLAVCFTYGDVYVSVLLPHFISHSPSPTVSTSLFIWFFTFIQYFPVTNCDLCVHAKSLQSCLTLCDPMDCSRPGSSVHVPRQEYWSGLPFPSSVDLPNTWIQPVSYVSCIGRWVLYHQGHLGSPSCDLQLGNYRPNPTDIYFCI